MEHWDRIEVCRRADGSAWVLGEGRFGKVHFFAQHPLSLFEPIYKLLPATQFASSPTCQRSCRSLRYAAAISSAESDPPRVSICWNALQKCCASQTACMLRFIEEC